MRELSIYSRFGSKRSVCALTLTAVYLIIVMSPLAPLAMHSKHVAHAVTGECVGDCSICGCSEESRATGTCCCAQKRHLEAKKQASVAAKPCCAKKPRLQEKDSPSQATAVLKCGCPCGKDKIVALVGLGSLELLPTGLASGFTIPREAIRFSDLSATPVSRQADPPTPPPKLHSALHLA